MRITNPEKQQQFAAYVSDFSSHIRTECHTLYTATEQLGQTLGADAVEDIQKTLREICRILDSGEPDLRALSQKLTAAAKATERLHALLRR